MRTLLGTPGADAARLADDLAALRAVSRPVLVPDMVVEVDTSR